MVDNYFPLPLGVAAVLVAAVLVVGVPLGMLTGFLVGRWRARRWRRRIR